MTATTAAPTWKNPRILLKHLTTWAARDDTRPDPQARAAAIAALDAVNDMIAELAALGARLTGEIAAEDMRQEMAAEAQAAEESRAGEAAPDAGPRPGVSDLRPGATFTCCNTPLPWPTLIGNRTCPECGVTWTLADVDVRQLLGLPEVAHEDPPAPPAPDPESPETRMLRAIHGLCPECDETDEHFHPCRVCGESTEDYHVHEEPPVPLYAVPKLYAVPGAGWVLQDPATCPHLNGMPDSEAGTWHCHDCGSDVYDDEQLAAIQAGFVSAAPVRAVEGAGITAGSAE